MAVLMKEKQQAASLEERILILAPVGRDGPLLSATLQRNGHDSEVYTCMGSVAKAIREGAGAAVVAEEALTPQAMRELREVLSGAPSWSDLPLLLLTRRDGHREQGWRLLHALDPVGNVTLIERPAQTSTLLSAVQVALRSRRRQYEVRDYIKEKERAEERIRRSEEQLRVITDSIPAFIAYVDEEGRYQFNNARYERALGCSREEIRGRLFREVLGEEAYQETLPYLRRVQNGETVSYERNMVEVDGNRLTIEVTMVPHRDAGGRPCGFYVLAHDITEQERDREALNRASQRVTEILESIQDGFASLDRDWRYTYINHSGAEMLGVHRDDLWGRVIWEKFPDLTEHETWERFHRVMETQEPEHYEMFDTGSRAWYQIRVYPAVNGISIFFTDISAEHEYQEQQDRLAAIFDATDEAIVIVDPELSITDINAAAQRMYGYPEEELLGKPISVLVPEDRISDLDLVRTQIGRGEKIVELETVRLSKNGRRVHVSLNVTPVLDEDGNLKALASVARDVTERRKAEEERARLAAIVRTSPDAIIGKDLDGVITSWNEGAEWLFGYAAQEATGQHIRLIVPEEQHEELDRILETVRAGDSIRELETIRRRKDGKRIRISLSASPLFDADGQVIGAATVERDITTRVEQKERLQKALAERNASVAQLEAIIEHVSDGLVIVDATGRIVTMNPAALDLHEYESMEAAFQSVEEATRTFELCSIEGRALEVRDWPVNRVMRGERFANMEIRVRNRKTGREWIGSYSAIPVRDQDGAIFMVVLTVRDITQLKKHEQQLEQLNVTLEQRVRERTRSLVQYQNRLRALATQLTRAEQIERRRLATDLHDYLAQMLVVCRMQVSRAAKLAEEERQAKILKTLDSYLDKSLTYTRTLVSELSPTVLYEAGIVAALQWLAEQMEEHGLKVEVQDGGEVDLPEEQAILIYQSVRELLFNIVKHARVGQARMEIHTDLPDRFRVTVVDEGAGFNPKELDGSGAGSGQFGLFNVQERLEALGGSLELRSSPGRGTRVTISLPLRHDSRGEEENGGAPEKE